MPTVSSLPAGRCHYYLAGTAHPTTSVRGTKEGKRRNEARQNARNDPFISGRSTLKPIHIKPAKIKTPYFSSLIDIGMFVANVFT